MPGKRIACILVALMALVFAGGRAEAVDYQGGSTKGSHGYIHPDGDYTNNGTVNATGGSYDWVGGAVEDISSGLFVPKGNVINNGTVTGNGGTGRFAYGVLALGDFINHGAAIGNGGSEGAVGINAPRFINYGKATGSGGDKMSSAGISSSEYFTNHGTAVGTGGRGEISIGLSGVLFTNYGMATGTGGGGERAYGILGGVDGFTNHGTAVGMGGSHGTAYGIGLDSSFTNNGMLILRSGGTAESVGFVNPKGSSISFAAGSILMLADGSIRMGDITGSASMSVDPGARIRYMYAGQIPPGRARGQNGFITGLPASPDTLFADYQTATLACVVTRDNNNQTSLDFSILRTKFPTFFASGTGKATLSWLEKGARGLVSDDDIFGNLPLFLLVSNADYLPNAGAVEAYAYRLAEEYTPQATASLLPSLAAVSRLTASTLASGLLAADAITDSASAGAALSAASGSAYASFSPDATRSGYFWATPLYYHGRLNGDAGYSTQRENAVGGSVGAALRRDRLTLGLAGHYLYSDIDGGGSYDANYNAYGVNAGASYRFDAGSLAPLLSLTGGWTRYDLDQTRKTASVAPGFAGNKYTSSPDIDVFSAALMLSNAFTFCRSTLTPELGLDYAYTDLRGYTEKGGDLALRVRRRHYTSAQGVLGLGYAYQATDRISLSLKGQYRHEFADKRATLRMRSVGYPALSSISIRGQNYGRYSGVLGTGVAYRATDRATVGLNYDLHLARRYQGHKVSANLGISF